ncbi:hypothetical protein J0X15_00210 [Roseibium sp. CAU 1637]|uniref:Uncharacterized protein n=1 Tax=Roseibium limicola TaxID=2816037 RepID=A0A939J7B1_9HYPH|nr:hypothetical protein [Roseibium limicola]MBO0343629.1 hypothetical protein [Roseibium limicola]
MLLLTACIGIAVIIFGFPLWRRYFAPTSETLQNTRATLRPEDLQNHLENPRSLLLRQCGDSVPQRLKLVPRIT